MTCFDVLCLANSNKMRGACFAGLRLDGGGWIRPVAATEFGELHREHFTLDDGSAPRVLDVVRIPFEGPAPAPHQPENWRMAAKPWRLVQRGLTHEVEQVLRAYIWKGPALLGDRAKRIPFGRFTNTPARRSLAVVAPSRLEWSIERTEFNTHKARALFELTGARYNLPVTDPAWIDAFRALPAGTHPMTACGIEPTARVLLTVSMGEPFDDGYCYKLVSAIVPLAAVAKPDAEPAMPPGEAVWIIDALAQGVDPYRGDPLPADSPLANPDTVKALRAASAALRRRLASPPGSARNSDTRLTIAFDIRSGVE